MSTENNPDKTIVNLAAAESVFLEQDLQIASVHNFSQLLSYLAEIDFDYSGFVITPELITEVDNSVISDDQETINVRIQQVLEISRQKPKLKILLGSAYWKEEMCFNSVLLLHQGEINQVLTKTHLLPLETQQFSPNLSPTTDIVGFPQARLLICKDLHIMGTDPETKNHELVSPELISPDTKVVIVSSCWGIGSRSTREMIAKFKKVASGLSTVDDFSNALYRMNLDLSIKGLFANYPSVEVIIVCDRPPLRKEPQPEDTITSTVSLSGIFHRQDML